LREATLLREGHGMKNKLIEKVKMLTIDKVELSEMGKH
jgi:hypothetical protein